MSTTILTGDCRELLPTLPAESVHCCVTSPPYWGLRDYGTATWEGGSEECDHSERRGGVGEASAKQVTSAGASTTYQYRSTCPKCGARRIDAQMGLEETPEAYVAGMVAVFREVRRIFRDDGTLWLNIGDSYVANGSGQVPQTKSHAGSGYAGPNRDGMTGLAPKNLVGIPWRLAFALQADGWYLRQDIIWHKPNPMPESVTDRCTKAHEYIFLLSKSPRYYYDAEAVKEACESSPSDIRKMTEKLDRIDAKHFRDDPGRMPAANPRTNVGNKRAAGDPSGRNRRSVWTVASQPYSGAHFATFPPKLIEPCILAGCPAQCCAKCGAPWYPQTQRTDEEDTTAKGSTFDGGKTGSRDGGDRTQAGPRFRKALAGYAPSCDCNAGTVSGTVLDPFGGSGTTGEVAEVLGRNSILIELNPKYVALAERRTAQLGLFCRANGESA